MTYYPLFKELEAIQIPLEDIYLDPNNPRFVGSKWDYVPNEEIDQPSKQEKAQEMLIEKFEVEKLRANMEVNGYLPIDRVIVRQFKMGKYVVLEGNRRICAAKLIIESAIKTNNLPQEILDSFRKIPCLLYTGQETDAAWIFQGLRHISGVVEWTAFNKAQLLVEQMDKEGLSLTEVGQRFGLTAFGAGQWVRGYKAYNQAREKTDYVYEVDEKSYPFFQELFGRSTAPVRDWLQWDDKEKAFKNELAFNEFVGWLYPREENGEEYAEGHGDWNKRVFKSRDEIRTLAYLLTEASDLFQQFRKTKNLEEVYSTALARKYEQQAREQTDRVAEVFDVVKECARALENAPIRILKKSEFKIRLREELQTLEEAISSIKETLGAE